MTSSALLSHRTLIRIDGPDRQAFLQGLVSNDVTKAIANRAIYAALLTPQGKFLHDIFLMHTDDAYWLDCEAERVDDLIRRLTAYKLRAKVSFENLGGKFDVWAIWNGSYSSPQSYIDPRLPELGMRVYMEKDRAPENTIIANISAYDERRLKIGIADGSRDMEIEKSTLAEGNFDLLNGLDWKKGCYIGQELTARMHYRGLAKKRLFPVRMEGPALSYGASLPGEGEMRSTCGEWGLALLKIEEAKKSSEEKKPLILENTRLWVHVPSWMKDAI